MTLVAETSRLNVHRESIAKGLSFVQTEFKSTGLQSEISSRSDMRRPIQAPEALFPGLSTFPRELFTRIVVADLLRHCPMSQSICDPVAASLQSLHRDGIFHFFEDPNLLPADLDCTALGLAVLGASGRLTAGTIRRVANAATVNTSDAGIIQVYLPPRGERTRIDPVVCANSLDLIATAHQQHESTSTENYIHHTLTSGTFLGGTRYYPSPDSYLFFLTRLVARHDCYRKRFVNPLREALCERIGATRTPLDLAMRVYAARQLCISNDRDEEALLETQVVPGVWRADGFFTFGQRRGYFGSAALTTAFAVCALSVKKTC